MGAVARTPQANCNGTGHDPVYSKFLTIWPLLVNAHPPMRTAAGVQWRVKLIFCETLLGVSITRSSQPVKSANLGMFAPKSHVSITSSEVLAFCKNFCPGGAVAPSLRSK